jgi:hypothetical protein
VIDADGTQVQLADWQDDIYDDDTDMVFRQVSWADDAVLHPGYGKAIDQMIADYRRDFEDNNTPDTMRLKIEVTIGDLRRLNCIAGYLQQQSRVRNPEIQAMLSK